MKIIFHNRGGFSPPNSSRRNHSSAGRSPKPTSHQRTASSHSLHSTASTEEPVSDPEESSAEDPPPPPPLPTTRQRPPRAYRAVHFNEQANVLHDNELLDRQEVNELWYSRFEFNRFRRETMQEAQAVVSAERKLPESENTSAMLLRAYQNFCNIQTSADLMAALADTNPRFSIPLRFIGLDRWTMNFLLQDKVERRQRILRQIHEIQRQQSGGHAQAVTLRQSQIRQVSRTISQPSRLYAHHVAQLAARVGV
mmetsp:Transcript_4101/g.8270  ORF Transcript_4101/g.8270 Transcript_4101/m.8270 type:complete len:253 (-) Transcript_4101:185-943(-)|eukprot:scaffold1684_cov214-Amphora_coffeaeformis.AAC.19